MKAMQNSMGASLVVLLTLLGALATPAVALGEGTNGEDDVWTQVGLYGLFLSIEGDASIRGVATEPDISFDDIWDNLDGGFMGYIEHRRGRWSFIGDVAYLKLEADKTVARRPALTVRLDAETEQLVLQGFVGYRLLRIPYSLLTGMISPQPAVLDFAEEQAQNPLPGIGYTLMFPLAIIINVILAQILIIVLSRLSMGQF